MAEGPKAQRRPAAENPSQNQRMPARRKARKRALDVLYEADLRDLPPRQVLGNYLERIGTPRPDHMDYATGLVEGVAKNLDRIDELIASYAEGWTLERMPVVDRNLARIAVYELLYVSEIDDPVAITEAVELAKQMSTDDSPRFLNGILGRIAEFATR
jgi:N utilization substance protein B